MRSLEYGSYELEPRRGRAMQRRLLPAGGQPEVGSNGLGFRGLG